MIKFYRDDRNISERKTLKQRDTVPELFLSFSASLMAKVCSRLHFPDEKVVINLKKTRLIQRYLKILENVRKETKPEGRPTK